MYSDECKTQVTFNNNLITRMLRNLCRYLLQHHGWQILIDQWRSIPREGYLISVLEIYI